MLLEHTENSKDLLVSYITRGKRSVLLSDSGANNFNVASYYFVIFFRMNFTCKILYSFFFYLVPLNDWNDFLDKATSLGSYTWKLNEYEERDPNESIASVTILYSPKDSS